MHIVIVGAGGSGISNLAHIIRDLGYKNLIAIDAFESQITTALKEKGIPTKIGHGKYDIKPDDIVIYSEATKDSPEVQSSLKLKYEHHQPLKIWNYFEFLGELSKYFRTVGFAGTNGKSSSTSLAIVTGKQLIPELGLGIVGALVPDLNNGSYYLNQEKTQEFRQLFDFIFTGKKLPYDIIKKYYFFLESCEYKRHFLHLDLEYLVISNIELDHTDYYKDLDDYRSAFIAMNHKTHKKTFVLENLGEEFINTEIVPLQHRNLDNVWGHHTDCNATLVARVLQEINPNITKEEIEAIMVPFKGIWRRLESLGDLSTGAKLFSDYGHIASSLALGYNTLKERFPDKKITAIFQPHQIHRVLTGWNDFKKALNVFDQSYIYSIYAAREKLSDFSDEEVFKNNHFDSVSEFGAYFAKEMGAGYLDSFDDVEQVFAGSHNDEIIIIFTAGDLDYQVRKYLKIC